MEGDKRWEGSRSPSKGSKERSGRGRQTQSDSSGARAPRRSRSPAMRKLKVMNDKADRLMAERRRIEQQDHDAALEIEMEDRKKQIEETERWLKEREARNMDLKKEADLRKEAAERANPAERDLLGPLTREQATELDKRVEAIIMTNSYKREFWKWLDVACRWEVPDSTTWGKWIEKIIKHLSAGTWQDAVKAATGKETDAGRRECAEVCIKKFEQDMPQVRRKLTTVADAAIGGA